MDLSQIAAEVTAAAEELIAVARSKEGRIFVLGCSTSEVWGLQSVRPVRRKPRKRSSVRCWLLPAATDCSWPYSAVNT